MVEPFKTAHLRIWAERSSPVVRVWLPVFFGWGGGFLFTVFIVRELGKYSVFWFILLSGS